MIPPGNLHHYRFFDGLDDDEYAAIAAIADEFSLGKGDVLFHAGDAANQLYLLADGGVELYHLPSPGPDAALPRAEAMYLMMEKGEDVPLMETGVTFHREFLVGTIRPGEAISISTLIDPYRVTATAHVTMPSRFVKVDAIKLRELCRTDYKLGCTLIQAAAKIAMQRLNFTRQQLVAERA
jgi:CRP-like cAMP-binding protein